MLGVVSKIWCVILKWFGGLLRVKNGRFMVGQIFDSENHRKLVWSFCGFFVVPLAVLVLSYCSCRVLWMFFGCIFYLDDQMNVPYPYNREDLQMDKRWLSCHPGSIPIFDSDFFFTNATDQSKERNWTNWHGIGRLLPSEVNKIGKNSYITGFGSRAREDTHENVRILKRMVEGIFR